MVQLVAELRRHSLVKHGNGKAAHNLRYAYNPPVVGAFDSCGEARLMWLPQLLSNGTQRGTKFTIIRWFGVVSSSGLTWLAGVQWGGMAANFFQSPGHDYSFVPSFPPLLVCLMEAY